MTKAKSKSKTKSKSNKKKTRSNKSSTKNKKNSSSKTLDVSNSKRSATDKKAKKEKNLKSDKVLKEEIKELNDSEKELTINELDSIKMEYCDDETDTELIKLEHFEDFTDTESSQIKLDNDLIEEFKRESADILAVDPCNDDEILSSEEVSQTLNLFLSENTNLQDLHIFLNENMTSCNSKKNKSKVNTQTVKQLQNEEVINCLCGYREEDGLMIQCDVCLTWQHALCCGINSDTDVPENYLCIFCKNPWNVRPTQRYSYAKHFLTLSKFPTFTMRTIHEDLMKCREDVMKKTFQLTSDLRNIYRMERTITAKLSIAEEQDHPKLYMWSANWDSQDQNRSPNMGSVSTDISIDGPIGEQPIESFDCRLRLLEKIDLEQRDLMNRLTLIYEQLQILESSDYCRKDEEKNLKKVLRMFEKDLKTVASAASIS